MSRGSADAKRSFAERDEVRAGKRLHGAVPPLGRFRAAIIEAAGGEAIPRNPGRQGLPPAAASRPVLPSEATAMLRAPPTTKVRSHMLDSDPIAPHGGTLVDLLVPEGRA
jgi:hypothetical protein